MNKNAVKDILEELYDYASDEGYTYRSDAITEALQKLAEWVRVHNPPPSRVGKEYLDGYYQALETLAREIEGKGGAV